ACTGGGLRVETSLDLKNSQFLSNTSQADGGGAYVLTKASLQGALFEANQCLVAPCSGGGLHAQVALAIASSQFLSNTAQNNGGGVYAGDTVVLTDTQFVSNTSQDDGGGLFATSGVTLTSGLFRANQCESEACSGGGLMAQSTL